MLKRAPRSLIALNVVLLIALGIVLALPQSPAPGQSRRGRGNYTMIAGAVTGRDNQAGIYIVETKSFQMAAIMFDSRANRFQIMANRNMFADLGG